MSATRRERLHIVYVLKACRRLPKSRIAKEIRALESLGHHVTVFARPNGKRERSREVISGLGCRVQMLPTWSDTRLYFQAARAHLAILMGSPNVYRAILRDARVLGQSGGMLKFVHAGLVAHASRRMGADHVHAHLLPGSARVARWSSALSGISYSMTAAERNGANGSDRDSRATGGASRARFVVPGAGSDARAVAALIGAIEEHAAPRAPAGQPVVLLVDPQREFRTSLARALVRRGVTVREADDLVEAVSRIRSMSPDAVLAGDDSNGANALGLLQRVRGNSVVRRVPFVLLTPVAGRELRLDAFREGVDDVVVKTGDLDEITARIMNVLTREASRRPRSNGSPHHGLSGRMESLPFTEVVQILGFLKKTACVTLGSHAGEGKVWFREGSVVHARCPDREGEDAFFHMLEWKSGQFSIEDEVGPYKRTIQQDTMPLVMEGLRRADEHSRDAADQAAS